MTNENAKMTEYEELEKQKKAIEEEQRKIKNELLHVYVNHLKTNGDFNNFLLNHSHSEIRRFADLAISSISKFEKILKKEQHEKVKMFKEHSPNTRFYKVSNDRESIIVMTEFTIDEVKKYYEEKKIIVNIEPHTPTNDEVIKAKYLG